MAQVGAVGNWEPSGAVRIPVSYAAAIAMTGLVACPFCREMFEPNEARSCPECGLRLQPLEKLPPSAEAQAEDGPIIETPPHMEELPWSYAGRGRALLLGLALVGLGLFFAPWVSETAPEIREWSGFEFARRLGWLWAPAVAWFVMVPLVLSRRSIYKMRGARVAVGFLAGIVLTTVAVRVGFTPVSSLLRPVRVAWGWGLYGSGVVALLALAVATRFGGRLDDVPTKQPRRGEETLH
jgi:hypothetical protein